MKERKKRRLQESSDRSLSFRVLEENSQKFFTFDELSKKLEKKVSPTEDAVVSALKKFIERGIIAYGKEQMTNPRPDYARFLYAKKYRPPSTQKEPRR